MSRASPAGKCANIDRLCFADSLIYVTWFGGELRPLETARYSLMTLHDYRPQCILPLFYVMWVFGFGIGINASPLESASPEPY